MKWKFDCYIEDYNIKLHPEESMYLGTLIVQEYPSGFFQPGTLQPVPKVRLIHPYLEISDSPFDSCNILTLDLLIPPRGNPTNITILYEPIYNIPYIPKTPPDSPIYNHLRMDTCRDFKLLPSTVTSPRYLKPLSNFSIKIKNSLQHHSSIPP